MLLIQQLAVQQEPVVKDNTELRLIVRTKIFEWLSSSKFPFISSGLVNIIEDYFLPSFVYFFYKQSSVDFLQYVKNINLKGKELFSVTSRIENLLKNITGITILGDVHPGFSTKYLKNNLVEYRKYPDYNNLLRSILSKIISDYEYYLPKIRKNSKEAFLREYVDINKETKNNFEIKQYYYNLGRFIPILLLLRAIDINAENMIISLPYPKFFDMETILSGGFENNFENYGIKNTGVIKVEKDNDTSLLTAGLNSRKSLLKPILKGTYKYPQIVWRVESKMKYNNIPVLNNTCVDPKDYLKEILEGYNSTAKKIISVKDILLDKTNIISASVRVILRPTRVYKFIMLKSCYPQVYEKREIEDFLTEKLLENSLIYKIEKKELIKEEVKSMKDLLIPVFYCVAQSREIISPSGKVVGTLVSSPFEYWREYVRNTLDNHFFDKQILYIKNAVLS